MLTELKKEYVTTVFLRLSLILLRIYSFPPPGYARYAHVADQYDIDVTSGSALLKELRW